MILTPVFYFQLISTTKNCLDLTAQTWGCHKYNEKNGEHNEYRSFPHLPIKVAHFCRY
jgi:hypothetical protein